MDAKHFRARAATARELATSGDDRKLAQMLLDVAADMDAEAAAIEAGATRTAPANAPERAAATPRAVRPPPAPPRTAPPGTPPRH